MNANSSAVATAPALSAREFDQACAYLEQTRNGLVGATKGLSEAQWRFKPAPGRWSIAENVEHVVVAQERILGPIWEQLASAPPRQPGVDAAEVDSIVLHRFPDRLSKFNAPDSVHPVGDLACADVLARLEKNYERLRALLESSPDLRGRAIESLPLKAVTGGAFQMMDGYQWILVSASHIERHTKQILEVMADPAFPEA